MSGILGLWNPDGRPVDRDLLARLSRTLAHRGGDAEGLWVRDAAGFACQLFRVTPESKSEVQPLVADSGVALVFDGRLDNREELFGALGSDAHVPADAPDPALVQAAYRAWGEGFIERLNGEFAIAVFDPHRQRILLARDAIGIRPLYYYRGADFFLFASEIKALLAHPQVSTQPNETILAEFLLHGLHDPDVDDDGLTFFEGVRSVLPSHIVRVTPQSNSARKYWDFDLRRRICLGSIGEYAEAFRERFTRAVRRRLRSAHPVAVLVSGGLDSSSILCTAETLRRADPGTYPPLQAISYTPEDRSATDESAFLRDIEREYGLAIERIQPPTGFLRRVREEVQHTEMPLLDSLWNTSQASFEAARQRGARVVLTGHWGDQILVDQSYLVGFVYRLKLRALVQHLQEYGRWFTATDPAWYRRRFFLDLIKYHTPRSFLPALRRLRRTFSRDITARSAYTDVFRQRARLRASKQGRWVGFGLPPHSWSLSLEVRARAHQLAMEWNNKVAAMYGLETSFPFLDRDLISFLVGVPGEIQTWQGVPKGLLRQAMRGVLPASIAERRWKAGFNQLVYDGTSQEYPQVRECLAGAAAVRRGYVRSDWIERELMPLQDQMDVRDCRVAWSLRDLVGLELWLQTFFGHEITKTSRGRKLEYAETI